MRIELMENKAKSTTTFEVDPEVEYRLLVEAESKGQDLIGIFHSHPAPPQPSSSDKRNMKLNPVVWLIASKTTGRWESRAYIMEDDEVVEVDISLT
jgi:proteasome lid subunit RPN8/RPN11